MSLTRRGTATPKLTTLPQDVLLHILDLMNPTQVALYAQLCVSTHRSSTDPTLWATIARRHLGISPVTPTPASISSLAMSLVSRWWLVTGAFVPGVPAHFRKGFSEIRARGGLEVPLADDAGDSAYVLGGRHKDLAVPAHIPGLNMDFFLDAAGPFPMAGMRVRLIHVAEEGGEPDLEPESYVGLPPGVHRGVDIARARVKVNGDVVQEISLTPAHSFDVMEFVIDADLLRTKPRVNNLAIEYDRSSSAAYWIREVLVMPVVLPMPQVEKEKLVFTAGLDCGKGTNMTQLDTEDISGGKVNRLTTSGQRNVSRVSSRASSRTPPRTRETSPRMRNEEPSSPRRVLRLAGNDFGKMFAPEVGWGGKTSSRKQKAAKMPKHMYHHSNYRSPRGHAPTSPRAKGR